ncbi:hypothetical protein COU18_00310 [Candidatus Kaiserbacteria bacterium CG10_big_fil_rev_8_21_14_0_10_51_14]|uniref:Uncharacterized protein n=1 Tax=Candidatus Kaiserbacteria bacterium CG10_big_fil_rev_8_21_14_0_10_51_14 TaxID=1974610 RepID=A0A2H0UCN2_9BACT|nr:MAG: hypothetical protein COU18_00310 [Candidatus Kaiserbacteria bacterium CG10_big_fil_rev_8_21_14_0_10_51_14]
MTDEDDIQMILKERFAQLPEPVRRAITSEDNSKHLRELGERHKLHIDQWEALENAVMMTLFGAFPIEDLEKKIKQEVGVSDETAKALTADISKIVFEPIREQLERLLEYSEAKVVKESGVEAARNQQLSASSFQLSEETTKQAATPLPVAPATPPPAPLTQRAERAPISAAYKAGQASSSRENVEDDPYREPPQ